MEVYVRYLQETLGVKSWVRVPAAAPVEASSFDLVFLSSTSLEPASREAELFERILTAIKKNPAQVGFAVVSTAEIGQILPLLEASTLVFSFVPEQAKFIENNFPRVSIQLLPSLAEMLAHPELKKKAWDIFKTSLRI